ncbi:MAG: hypothetical protein WCC81_24500 [Pseudolabrys sp.]
MWGRLGVGVAGAGGLAGLGLTAAFAVGVVFLCDERRICAFFTGFFLVAAVFLRVVALATWGFLRFGLVLPLAFFLVRI